uniref:PAN domain protein n=1 Tax=Caenorhabditis tropicalis TaxID=1561998 RepID=A0A1I7TJ13_9PELO
MNPIEVIFNITTEAKLMHTCRTYSRILPCFDQKMVQCGTPAEKSQLERGKRLHTYLCAPFSLQRQKIFLRRSKCIQEVLEMPQNSDCNRNDTVFAEKLQSCKEMCNRPDCLTKIELSEVSTCTYINIGKKCTAEAAQFFAQMQQVLTNKEYPMQCQYDLSRKPAPELRKGLPMESLVAQTTSSTTYVTVHPPEIAPVIDGVITRTSLPIMRRTDPNSKFKPRPTISQSSGPVIKTVIVDERGAPMTPKTTTQRPKVVHKFLPNPYTTKNPNALKNDIVRTTRTIIPAGDKKTQTYVPWNYKSDTVQVSTLSSLLAPIAKPAENVLSAPPVAFKFNMPPDQNTTQPFRVEINWHDDDVKEEPTQAPGTYASPWFLKTQSYQPPEIEYAQTTTTPSTSPLEAVNPLLDQLKSNSLNFTELGNQANNYFSAALSAFAETKKEMAHNDPWRTLIDAVAPTIHKLSPEMIPRIREEINRIQPQQRKQ